MSKPVDDLRHSQLIAASLTSGLLAPNMTPEKAVAVYYSVVDVMNAEARRREKIEEEQRKKRR